MEHRIIHLNPGHGYLPALLMARHILRVVQMLLNGGVPFDFSDIVDVYNVAYNSWSVDVLLRPALIIQG